MADPTRRRGPSAGVVVPAHDEAATIARLLTALASDPENPLEVVVVCNGCTDATAAVARRSAPGATILEISEPSKRTALDRGDEVAATYPRVYIDADVEITAASVAALVAALADPAIHAVGPRRRIPRGGVAWTVRWYYDIWEMLPQVRDGLFGRGVIAVDEIGHARVRALPHMLSDDLVVSEAFAAEERAVVTDATVVVYPPRTFSDLLRRRVRVATGNVQADSAGLRGRSAATTPAMLARLAVRHPRVAPKVAVFVGVAILARVQASRAFRSGDFLTWQRDESSRGPVAP